MTLEGLQRLVGFVDIGIGYLPEHLIGLFTYAVIYFHPGLPFKIRKSMWFSLLAFTNVCGSKTKRYFQGRDSVFVILASKCKMHT